MTSTPDIIKCNDDTQYFWLSWADGVIEVGSGSVVRSGQFLYWASDNSLFINSVALGSGSSEISYDIWQQQGLGFNIMYARA